VEITGQVTMTRALLGRLLRLGLRRAFLRYRIVGVLLILAGVLMIWPVQEDRPAFAVGLLAGGLVALVGPELTLWQTFRRMRMGEGQLWTYRLSPAGAGQTNPLAEITIGWQRVARVTETAEAWLLRLRPGGLLVVPKAAFDPAGQGRVADLLAGMGFAR
jgi:YcxB-like protein